MMRYECKYCGKLFFKGDVKDATIEVKCRNCKNFNVIKKNPETLLFSDGKENYKR